jgi:hypothetical protein
MTAVLRPRVAGLVAAALAAAAGLVGLSTAPASAALCSGKGVNVVVDFNGLGGGVQKGCAPNGANKSGDTVFPAAGFALKYAQRQPGFVCRVKNTPSKDPCVNTAPANAYWGLYWSDGKSGTWKYSSSGVGSLKVSNGGFMAFSWQNGGANDPPSATPRNAKPAPAPTKAATKAPPKGSSGGQGGSQGGSTKATKAPASPEPTKAATKAATKAHASTQPEPGRSRSAKHRAKASASASAASASPSPSAASSTPDDDASPAVTSTEPTSSDLAPTDEDGGLPAWVPIGVLVLLGAAAGAAVWWRRKTGAV